MSEEIPLTVENFTYQSKFKQLITGESKTEETQ